MNRLLSHYILPIGLAAVITVMLWLSLYISMALSEIGGLGYDWFFGFLFSPIWILRISAIINMIAAACVIGSLVAYRRWRNRIEA